MKLAAPFETLFTHQNDLQEAAVSVAISCFKYGNEANEAMATLLRQTEPCMNLVIVDDCSPDNSVAVMQAWLTEFGQSPKFANITLVRHQRNQGLSQSRNTALSLITTPYIMILDADNQLYPRAVEKLRQAIEASGYAMAYSLVERFGDDDGLISSWLWDPELFRYGNYIDAMALIRTDVLRTLGGYRIMPDRFGWEDYDLWCSFVDHGLKGCYVPQVLCRYRVHAASMTQNLTNPFISDKLAVVREDLKAHHKLDFAF